MKTFILLAMLLMPCASWAQSEWEIPDFGKKEQPASKKQEATKKRTKAILPQYNIGAVPEVDGKVEWSKDINVSGVNAETLYERMLKITTSLIKEKKQTANSRISAVNKRERIIAATMEEEMVFSTSTFAKDFAHFRYSVIAECKDNSVNIRLCRMSYKYDIGRTEEQSYTAEEMITDTQAINKKGTKMFRTNGKFRTGTIDRVAELFMLFEERLTSAAE